MAESFPLFSCSDISHYYMLISAIIYHAGLSLQSAAGICEFVFTDSLNRVKVNDPLNYMPDFVSVFRTNHVLSLLSQTSLVCLRSKFRLAHKLAPQSKMGCEYIMLMDQLIANCRSTSTIYESIWQSVHRWSLRA